MNDYITEVAKAIKSRCDGAVNLDYVGFNKPDADFIRDLLSQPVLTQSQLLVLGEHLLKYRRQITEDLGLDYERLKSEVNAMSKTVERKANANAWISNGVMHIKSPYSDRFNEEIRKLKSRRWDPVNRVNIISDPGDAKSALAIIYSVFGVSLTLPINEMSSERRIFGTATLENGCVVLSMKYSDFFLQDIKEIKGFWQPSNKTWSVRISRLDQAVKLESMIEKYDIKCTPEVLGYIEQRMTELAKFAQEKKELIDLSGAVKVETRVETPKGLTLFPFQAVGVEFIGKVNNALIADEMGLGKTVEVLDYLYNNPDKRPVIVVCPSAVKFNWKNEIAKWCPGSSVVVVSGRKNNINGKGDFYILNYDIVAGHFDELLAIGAKILIVDESHYIKNYKAKRSKCVITLSKSIPQVICLTGTPILNRPIELFTTFSVLKIRDHELRDFWTYAKEFCNATETSFGWDLTGASNLDKLQVKLRSTCMIRRLKKDVLKELPPKQRFQIPVEITNRNEYDFAMHEFSEWYYQNEGKRVGDTELLVKIEKLKQLVYKGKTDAMIEFIEDTLEQKQKIVVFAHHIELQQKLFEELKKYGAVQITGNMTAEERQKTVESFNNGARVCVCSIKAGGVGINLQSADTAIFTELGWTPSEHSQAEDRLHRIGQAGNVQCYYITAQNTIEQHVAAVLMDKQSIIDAAIDGVDNSGSTSVLGEVMTRMFG